MPYPLSPEARALQAAVRRYVDDELIPWEVHAEMNHGEVPPEILARQKKAARDLGLNSMDAPGSPAALRHGSDRKSVV